MIATTALTACPELVNSKRKVIFLASFEVDPRRIRVWSATTRLPALRRWKLCQPNNSPSPVTIAAQASDIIECDPDRSVGVAWLHRQVHFGDGFAAIASNDEPMVLGNQGCAYGRPEPGSSSCCQTRVEFLDRGKGISQRSLVPCRSLHVCVDIVAATVDTHSCLP